MGCKDKLGASPSGWAQFAQYIIILFPALDVMSGAVIKCSPPVGIRMIRDCVYLLCLGSISAERYDTWQQFDGGVSRPQLSAAC